MRDDFGDRMKAYEDVEAKRRLEAGPVCARIDGRCFSKFTKAFDRPYDARIANAMKEACRYLVEQTHARIGYVQSDEISLVWDEATEEQQMFFNARIQKLCSVLASMATASFTQTLSMTSPEQVRKSLPHFDARVWTVPTEAEATNVLLWRAQDARKNGVSSAARTILSAKEMHGLNQLQMLEEMERRGMDYAALPEHHRFGTFYRRETGKRVLTESEWYAIPKGKRPPHNEPVTRSAVHPLPIEYFGDIVNRQEVVFNGDDPVSV